MGQRGYPPLTPSEVIAILAALGFAFDRMRGSSHAHYVRPADGQRERAIVTVDMAERDFGIKLLKSMIRQSGFTREEFYGATEKTRKKIGAKG